VYSVAGVGEVREAYDVAEVQDCHSQLRMCMQRISDVEAINVDLESRLEAQAREYIDLESDAADSLTHWKAQYNALVEEAANWKRSYEHQELKSQKIREQLLRTERELHGILQKKYDIMEFARREERYRIRAEQSMAANLGASLLTLSSRNNDIELACLSSSDRIAWTLNNMKHPRHKPLGALPQYVRRGRAVLALADFFGFKLGESEFNLEHRNDSNSTQAHWLSGIPGGI